MYERGAFGAPPGHVAHEPDRSDARRSLVSFLVTLPLLASFLGVMLVSAICLGEAQARFPAQGNPWPHRPGHFIFIGCLAWLGFFTCATGIWLGMTRGFGGKSGAWTACGVAAAVLAVPCTSCFLVWSASYL